MPSLSTLRLLVCFFFFFNDTATTEIYTLSLHDALPIRRRCSRISCRGRQPSNLCAVAAVVLPTNLTVRSEEHTSELQSLRHLVCRLLLEKQKGRHEARRSPRARLSRRGLPRPNQLPSRR